MKKGQFALGFLSACALFMVGLLTVALDRTRGELAMTIEALSASRRAEKQTLEVLTACHGAVVSCSGAVERCCKGPSDR